VTQSDCLVYQDVTPGTVGADGQALGQGCVYPAAVKTVADQLQGAGLSWKGYMQDMANAAPAQPATCRHPALNSRDDTQNARAGDQYAARHNPFVYFHSLIDTPACAANDVPLDVLTHDLAIPEATPNLAFITPNLCDDGHDATCVDGRAGGPVAADAFLRQWVPRILASPAFRADGLLIVTFDEAEFTPPGGDASACCNEPMGPNTINPGGPIPGAGGGRVGAVLLSPFVAAGTKNATPYNHYALLRTIEDVFGLPHLGYAGQDGLKPFGSDVFQARGSGGGGGSGGSQGGCPASSPPRATGGKLKRGSLVTRAKLTRARRGGPARLELVVNRSASLRLTADPAGRARSRRVGPRRLAACRTYRIRLPGRHGRASLTAKIAGGAERRALRY
jgi:hypothetical protein